MQKLEGAVFKTICELESFNLTLVDKKEILNTHNEKLILKNNDISPSLRLKMIDWMQMALSTLALEESTFELAITLMDSYILKAKMSSKFS